MQRRFVVALAAMCGLVAAGFTVAEEKVAKPARILMVTQSAGFKHGSVSRKENQLAPAERAVTEIGIDSNLFRVDCTQDAERDFTQDNLQNYDIVFFYTTGNLPIKEEHLKYFYEVWLKQEGHGFIGAHSAADTYHNDERYWDMIGGTFISHPWGSGDTVNVTVHDKTHPASKPWGDEFTIKDEIYRFRNWQPEKVRVLASLNMAKTPNKIDQELEGHAKRQEKEAAEKNKPELLDEAAKTRAKIGQGPYHIPILWVKNYGDGKVMHMSLGHNEQVWDNETYRASLLGGIKWVLGKEKGDATPNPKVSEEQEKKSKAEATAQK